MRLATILLMATMATMAALLAPATGWAQPYRNSVLWTAPDSTASANTGEAGSDSAAAEATQAPDTARVFHAPTVAPFDPRKGEPVIVAPIFGSLVCGAALAYTGVLMGTRGDQSYDDIPPGALEGYLIGETIGVPLGAHIGNAGRGNLAGDLGISILGHILAIGLAGLGDGAGYIAGLSVQVLATVVSEQASGRHRALAKHRELLDEGARAP